MDSLGQYETERKKGFQTLKVKMSKKKFTYMDTKKTLNTDIFKYKTENHTLKKSNTEEGRIQEKGKEYKFKVTSLPEKVSAAHLCYTPESN